MKIETDLQERCGRQSGFSLIELMFAVFILATALIGGAFMIVTAISGTTKARLDTGSTMVAQSILDRYATLPSYSNSVTFTVQDCAGTNHTFSTGDINGDGGAALTAGQFDWSAAYSGVPANFKALYVGCASGNAARRVTYEVRVNVDALSSDAKAITVGVRPYRDPAAASRAAFQNITVPITLRTVAAY